MLVKYTIESNLDIMESKELGGMVHRIGFESMGGNAGNYLDQCCSAMNFRYDPGSGRIIHFENYTDRKSKKFDGTLQGSFIMSMQNLNSSRNHGIVSVYLYEDICSKLLVSCARIYNLLNSDDGDRPKLIVENRLKIR